MMRFGRNNSNLMWMILNGLQSIGPCVCKRLLEYFGNVEKIFSAPYDLLLSVSGISNDIATKICYFDKYFNLQSELNKLQNINAKFYSWEDKEYPNEIKNIYDPPIGLYYKGNLDLNAHKKIAIVGTRKASTYGLKIAREFAKELASLGYVIVSGMASGIDSAAHEGALASGNPSTIAVLGTGIDKIYPQENSQLYYKIAESGALISEFVLGRSADKKTFPIRNRIIAGISACVIVTESGPSGGSNITANLANEYGRSVFAVPGRIDQESSRGCHNLIREGATLVSSIDDILEEIHANQQSEFKFAQDINIITDPIERKIIEILKENGPIDCDDLMNYIDLPLIDILPRLQIMELKQYIVKNTENQIESLM